ncbi:hypothetical protein [Priestia megaterium]|uniref:hypothetical protein n=1 Tax=Priestia megaterium TaxID=1404 RepID=UPI000BFC469B|nr:hypothetical protein [Priestia megaterium]PGQ88231.1 hypothetical protein COA18_04710 [Priestia megaterium]
MEHLLVKGQYPKFLTSVDTFHFIEDVLEIYEEIVTDSYHFKLKNHIPAFTDFMQHEDFSELLDNLTSIELYGIESDYAPVDDDSVEEFWSERSRQVHLAVQDLVLLSKFYNVSYCLNREDNDYINLPVNGVW